MLKSIWEEPDAFNLGFESQPLPVMRKPKKKKRKGRSNVVYVRIQGQGYRPRRRKKRPKKSKEKYVAVEAYKAGKSAYGAGKSAYRKIQEYRARRKNIYREKKPGLFSKLKEKLQKKKGIYD